MDNAAVEASQKAAGIEMIVKSTVHQVLDPVFMVVSPETAGFLVVIAGFTLLFHIRFSASVAYTAPAVLTTLGILGTFVGIALGLSDFDVNNVQKSVPSLIDGIKTAVWASAWGIFCALTIKMREIMFGASDHASGVNSGVTINDLAELLASLQQAVIGNETTNMLTFLKLVHKENKEILQNMNHTLDNFCTKMVGSCSETMVDALKEVVGDFNNKVDTQFGGNLRQLSDEVKSSNDEHKEVMLGAIQHFNEEFNTNIQQSVESAKVQLATLEAEQSKILEKQGKEFASLSQNMARMIRQLHNDSMLTIK